ncbi:MAG: type 1 periplasmic-binding domain-containing protein [Acidimicrobiales bacterium]
MTPFQQFRLWARRAPIGERVSTAVAAAVVLALLVWAVAPAKVGSGRPQVATTNSGARSSNASSADQPGAASDVGSAVAGSGASGSGTGTALNPGPGATKGAPASRAAAAGRAGSPGEASGAGSKAGSAPLAASAGLPGAAGCASPPGTDQGITATEIKVVVTLVDLVGAAGNSTFGVPSVPEQQLDYQQVIDSVNAAGGVACRKIVPHFYTANPIDNGDMQQKCLDIVGVHPFFVLDAGGYYGSPISNCFPQHQLPFLGTGRIVKSQRDQFYPYLFSIGSYEDVYRNMVFALKDRGFFSPTNGFKKLGFAYRDCFATLNTEFLGWLAQAGVPSSQIVTYDFGCPQGFSSPSDIQQAVLKFEEQGVTNVTESQFYPDWSNFTKISQQQGFKPRYGLADDGLVPISTSKNLGDDYNNMDGAIVITADRYGEETTPSYPSTPATKSCDAIFTAKGRPPVYQQPVGLGGVACDEVWMLRAAIEHASSLERTSLAAGLQAARTIDLSFPRGPADFTGPRVTYGDEFWRPEQFAKSCGCWKILNPTFTPGFP